MPAVSLRVTAATVIGLVAMGVIASPAAAPAAVAVVRVVETSAWSPPSPDPMGLGWIGSSKTLVIADSEVEETRLYAGVSVWIADRTMAPTSAFGTSGYTDEPADVAVGPRGNMLFFSDDKLDRIYQVSIGKDRRFGTNDDRIRSFSSRTFGSADPEGLGYGRGALFVTDGNDQTVFRLTPGRNGRFDGGRPSGDDRVRSFGTRSLGLGDPEDVAYDPTSGHLYLVSRIDRAIVEATRKGRLVARLDITASGIRYPSGIAVVRYAGYPGGVFAYVADRGTDNNAQHGGDPNENDGRLFEFVLASAPDTDPPSSPTGVTASMSGSSVVLDWTDNPEPDLSGYTVYRADGSGGWAPIATIDPATSGYVDPSPTSTPSYRVTASDAWGNESPPAEVSPG